MSEPLCDGTESSTVPMGCQEEIPCILVSYFSHSIPLWGTARAVQRLFLRETAHVWKPHIADKGFCVPPRRPDTPRAAGSRCIGEGPVQSVRGCCRARLAGRVRRGHQ